MAKKHETRSRRSKNEEKLFKFSLKANQMKTFQMFEFDGFCITFLERWNHSMREFCATKRLWIIYLYFLRTFCSLLHRFSWVLTQMIALLPLPKIYMMKNSHWRISFNFHKTFFLKNSHFMVSICRFFLYVENWKSFCKNPWHTF